MGLAVGGGSRRTSRHESPDEFGMSSCNGIRGDMIFSRTRRLKIIGAYLLLAASGATLAWSDYEGATLARPLAEESNFTLQGKIARLEPPKFTVSTEENIVFHVRYTDKTEIKRSDGSLGTSKDMRVGILVHIEGDLRESGEVVAATIQIVPPRSSKPH
jgi:hypothetical protein